MTDLPSAKDVFTDAIELSPDQQRGYVERACRGNNALLAEIFDLLATHKHLGTFLDAPTFEAARTSDIPASENVITTIGPYKVLQAIGEGGFGTVYLADQVEPVRRRVALKVVKPGMNSKLILARFDQERQALAAMDHPNIAKLFDGGTTPSGLPYFVMEYVKGEPITRYCNEHKLSISDRVRVFAQACRAVQHAHMKGIIHRDIKPSNVLAFTLDNKPTVKVIDFGIAKVSDRRLTDMTLFTEHRSLIGTLEYMSPEQADGLIDIDTRTDVYSLGVLLYELLTGSTPLDRAAMSNASLAEIQRVLREVDPSAPSDRLKQSPRIRHSIGTARDSDATRLASNIRGELDWIVMRAIEKDRTRRYETPLALAQDVERYLDGEPVQAAPPSNVYRAHKFIRRNRVPVAATAAISLTLLVGAIGTTWGFIAASRRADSERAAKEKAQASERLAEEREQQTFQVANFQQMILNQINPSKAGREMIEDVAKRFEGALAGDNGTLASRATEVASMRANLARINATDAAQAFIDRAILSPAVSIIDQEFATQEQVGASLRQSLADIYVRVGLHKPAEPLQAAALEARLRLLGPENPKTLHSLNSRVSLLRGQGRNAEAQPLLEQIVLTRRRLLGNDDEQTIRSIHELGLVYQSQHKMVEAVECGREAAERATRVFGQDDPATLAVVNSLAGHLRIQEKFVEAEPLSVDTLARRRRVMGPESPDTANSIRELGLIYMRMQRWDDGEPLLREALASRRTLLGENHPSTLDCKQILALLLYARGKLDEAESLLREAWSKIAPSLGPDHGLTINCGASLAVVLGELGKLEEAEPLAREAMNTAVRVFQPDHPETVRLTRLYAITLGYLGRTGESVKLLRQAHEAATRMFGPDDTTTILVTMSLGTQLRELNKLDEAEPLLRDAATRSAARLGESNQISIGSARELAVLLSARGGQGEAEEKLRAILATSRRVQGDEHSETLATVARLVDVLLASGSHEDAEALALPAATIAAVKFQPGQKIRERLITSLAHALDARDKAEPGRGFDQRAAEWRSKLRPVLQ